MVAPSERLQRPPENAIWIGEDFVLTRLLVVPPDALLKDVEVAFGSSDFPQDLSRLRISTCSRHALLALEIVSSGEELAESFRDEKGARTYIRFKNHGRRTAVIDGGNKVGRPYIEGEANIEGEALNSMLGKTIQIDGPATSWERILNADKKPIGVRLYLDPESRRQILPGRLIVLNGEPDYRRIIDKFTGPIEPSMDENFWFAQTAHTKIKKGVVGILKDSSSPRTHMLNSHLIYGGQTDWPIRVEFVGPTFSTEMPTHVDMVFQKTA